MNFLFDFLGFLRYKHVIDSVNYLLIVSMSLNLTLESIKLLKNLLISFSNFAFSELLAPY